MRQWNCILLLALSSAIHANAQLGDAVITTIAGRTDFGSEPSHGFGGDEGPARRGLLALANVQNECDPNRFEQISHLAVDASGQVYVADSSNHRIRRISRQSVITTVAGSGERPAVDPRTCSPVGGSDAIGDGGQAAVARLFNPSAVVLRPNGSLIIADQQNNRIRQISTTGVITTIAGNGLHAFYAPQIPALGSGLDWPTALAVDRNGLVHFSELHSGRVARIGADGRLVTVAGSGIPGFNTESGSATSVRLSNPTGIAFDSLGNLYIADQGNHRVRKVTPDGNLTTIAGSRAGFAGDGGLATAALLDRPADVKVDSRANVYIADMNNYRVRRIDASGVITTVAGDGLPLRGPDGVPAIESSLSSPTGLAIDASDNVFVIDWQNYLVRKISFHGEPAITSQRMLNGASFAAGPVAPGSLFSIFGVNLAPSLAQAAQAPWPIEMSDTRVNVNGQAAPLYFVSPRQINAQLPYSAAVGEATVIVTTERGVSPPEFLGVASSAIGVFVYPESRRAIALNQDNSLNAPDNPEARGGVLTVFLTGVGSVSPDIARSDAAPLDTLHRATTGVSATLSGAEATVQFLGLTPGFVGLAQANVEIPSNAVAGLDTELVFRSGPISSSPVTVSIR